MKSLRLVLSVLAVAFATSVFGQEFFSKDEPKSLFNIGLRLGLNTSNRTFSKDAFDQWNVNSWGTGVDAGCVVDINIRDYISLQPGLFVETRSGNYSYAQYYYDNNGKQLDFTQLGHDRSFNVTIPVLASLKLNLTENVRLVAEIGPYVQYFIHDSASDKIQVIVHQTLPSDPIKVKYVHPVPLDAGLKAGCGISLFKRYSFFIHYMAGAKKAWKEPFNGGKNKAWLFTVGYQL